MPLSAHASTYGTFLTEFDKFSCYGGQVVQNKDFNFYVGAVLKGEYKKRSMTVESLADTTGIPYSTLRKKFAGDSPILVSEVVILAKTIGISPAQVLTEAETMLGQQQGKDSQASMSAPSSTTNDIDTKRKQNEARAMTTEQIEKTKHAATRDPEMDNDEPN